MRSSRPHGTTAAISTSGVEDSAFNCRRAFCTVGSAALDATDPAPNIGFMDDVNTIVDMLDDLWANVWIVDEHPAPVYRSCEQGWGSGDACRRH